jgi:hypothetical protein
VAPFEGGILSHRLDFADPVQQCHRQKLRRTSPAIRVRSMRIRVQTMNLREQALSFGLRYVAEATLAGDIARLRVHIILCRLDMNKTQNEGQGGGLDSIARS